jgi:chemotaxis protein MotB
MNWKRQTGCFLLLAFGVLVVGGCIVSKKDYLLKVEESQNLSRELAALRSEDERLKGDKEALDKQVIALQEQRDDLENARTQLQLKNLSLENEVASVVDDNIKLEELLRAKSDTLSKNIVDLRDHVGDLKKENKLLKQDNTNLSQDIETLKVNVGNLQDQVMALEKKNEALQDKANALERQRKEEILAMKGTYESLLENMESEIEKGKITITQLKGKLKVNMLDEILFDSGKTSIKPQGFEVLERVGKILSDVKDRNITIEGHTDNVPIGPDLGKKYPTNWELSAARATTVARYLQEKIGINPGVLSATGYGEYQPIASNETKEGKARNRRIEIVLIPKEISPISRE